MNKVAAVLCLLGTIMFTAACSSAPAAPEHKPRQRVEYPLVESFITEIKGSMGDNSGMLQIRVRGVYADKAGNIVEGDAQIASVAEPQICDRVIVNNFYRELQDDKYSTEAVPVAQIDYRYARSQDVREQIDNNNDGTISVDEELDATFDQIDRGPTEDPDMVIDDGDSSETQ